MASNRNPDQNLDETLNTLNEHIEEEESYRNNRISTDLLSEYVRLQNLSIFVSLKKTAEEIDSKSCRICQKNRKEILWSHKK